MIEGVYEYVIHKQVIRVNKNFNSREEAVKEATDLLKRYREADTLTEYWYELVREGENE